MFDLGWSELAVLAVVALVFPGPKDLPRVLRTVGLYVRKARKIAAEFQSSVEEMAREAEFDEIRKQIDAAAKVDVRSAVESVVDPTGELGSSLSGASSFETSPPPPAILPRPRLDLPTPGVESAGDPRPARP